MVRLTLTTGWEQSHWANSVFFIWLNTLIIPDALVYGKNPLLCLLSSLSLAASELTSHNVGTLAWPGIDLNPRHLPFLMQSFLFKVCFFYKAIDLLKATIHLSVQILEASLLHASSNFKAWVNWVKKRYFCCKVYVDKTCDILLNLWGTEFLLSQDHMWTTPNSSSQNGPNLLWVSVLCF